MRIRAALLAASILPATLLTVAAGDAPDGCRVLGATDVTAEDGTVSSEDVLACASDVYLGGCGEAAGGKVYNQLVQGNVPLTTFTAPTGSFTEGAGCGSHEEPVSYGIEPGNPFYDLTMEGYFFGNLDELEVELHDIYAGPERASGSLTLQVRLEVDGESLFGSEQLTNAGGDQTVTSPTVIDVTVTPEMSSTGLSEALRFSVGDLHAAMGGAGAVAGDGADEFHTVRLTISVPIGGHAIVWDATEIPSGLHFNQGTGGTVLQYGTGAAIG